MRTIQNSNPSLSKPPWPRPWKTTLTTIFLVALTCEIAFSARPLTTQTNTEKITVYEIASYSDSLKTDALQLCDSLKQAGHLCYIVWEQPYQRDEILWHVRIGTPLDQNQLVHVEPELKEAGFHIEEMEKPILNIYHDTLLFISAPNSVWQVSNGSRNEIFNRYEVSIPMRTWGQLGRLSFSPDDSLIGIVYTHSIHVLNLVTGDHWYEEATSERQFEDAWAKWSPLGKYLVSCPSDSFAKSVEFLQN